MKEIFYSRLFSTFTVCRLSTNQVIYQRQRITYSVNVNKIKEYELKTKRVHKSMQNNYTKEKRKKYEKYVI